MKNVSVLKDVVKIAEEIRWQFSEVDHISKIVSTHKIYSFRMKLNNFWWDFKPAAEL